MTMPGTARRFAIALSLSAAIAASLIGCTPPGPAPTPTPTLSSVSPTPTPTPTPTPVVIAEPAPVLDLTCADLAGSSTIAAAVTAAVTPVDPAQTLMGAYPVLADTYAVRSLGGLACEWSNGEPQSDASGLSSTYVGARVLVLPNATSQWDRFISYYGASAAGDYCATATTPLFCTTDALVGSTWVELTVRGASSSAGAAALGADVVSAVTAAGSGAALWTPPAGTTALPADCPGVITDATVQSALGLAVPVQASSGGGGWSIESGARENWGGPHCYWALLDSDSGVGSLATLPGGAWAWDEARAFITVPSAPEVVSIAGLAAGDEAWLRCAAADAYCVIDLVLGGNWVEAYIWRDGPTPDRRAGALAVGAAIVASIG